MRKFLIEILAQAVADYCFSNDTSFEEVKQEVSDWNTLQIELIKALEEFDNPDEDED